MLKLGGNACGAPIWAARIALDSKGFGRAAGAAPVVACMADPGGYERAGGDSGGAEDDQPRVGFVQAEGEPAGQFAKDQQPGSRGDAIGASGVAGGPD